MNLLQDVDEEIVWWCNLTEQHCAFLNNSDCFMYMFLKWLVDHRHVTRESKQGFSLNVDLQHSTTSKSATTRQNGFQIIEIIIKIVIYNYSAQESVTSANTSPWLEVSGCSAEPEGETCNLQSWKTVCKTMKLRLKLPVKLIHSSLSLQMLHHFTRTHSCYWTVGEI